MVFAFHVSEWHVLQRLGRGHKLRLIVVYALAKTNYTACKFSREHGMLFEDSLLFFPLFLFLFLCFFFCFGHVYGSSLGQIMLNA